MTIAVEVSLQGQRGLRLAGGNDYPPPQPPTSDFLNKLSDSLHSDEY